MALHEIHWNPSARAMVLVPTVPTRDRFALVDPDVAAALRCVGNAIQPQTAAVAWSHLVARLVRQAAA